MATHTRAWLAQPASWARERGWRSRPSHRGSGLHSPAGGEGCSGGSPLHASRSTRAHEGRTARGEGGRDKERQNKAERKTDKEMVWTDDGKAGMNQRVIRAGMDKGWLDKDVLRCLTTLVLVLGVSRCRSLKSLIWPLFNTYVFETRTRLNTYSIQIKCVRLRLELRSVLQEQCEENSTFILCLRERHDGTWLQHVREPVWLRLTRAYPTGPSARRLEGNAGNVARWRAPAGGTSSPAVAPGVRLTGLQGGTGYTPAGRLDGGEPLGKRRSVLLTCCLEPSSQWKMCKENR